MTNPQFNCQEDLEAYLAAQNQRREARTREEVFFWKKGPMILGTFVIGFAIMFAYPETELNSKKNRSGSQHKQAKRFDRVLQWLGVDIEQRKRDHQSHVEERNQYSMPYDDTSWSMSELPQLFD